MFSFLNSAKHQELTQETYNFRDKNDKLQIQIDYRSGKNIKLEDVLEKGDKAPNEEIALKLTKQRMIAGWKNATDMLPEAERTDAPYEKDIDENLLKFKPYNIANKEVGDSDDGKATPQVAAVQIKAEDTVNGKANVAAAKAISDAAVARTSSLKSRIRELNGEINVKTTSRDNLGDEIKKYVEAEAKITKMFVAEGITDLEGGKNKLAELEGQRKSRISDQKKLQQEKVILEDKQKVNNEKIASQEEYKVKRKVSLGTNSKTYRLSAVDFDWGFAVVKTDETTKFFINQKLMIVRGGKHIGDVIISSIEPGRVMANIDYKSVAKRMTLRAGDTAILSEPVDR